LNRSLRGDFALPNPPFFLVLQILLSVVLSIVFAVFIRVNTKVSVRYIERSKEKIYHCVA